ncbi:MAG: type I secretion C-terminal target domain-containing protein, partial [Methylococcales bacterium]|nr:type I secretion C-terminal target domain-containing protein [Methylococcales bacterium]
SPDTGTSNTDFVTKTAAQTVSGTFNRTLASGEKIQVSADGGTTWVDASTSDSNWTAAVTLGATGNLTVRTIDTAGNVITGTGHVYTLDTAGLTAASLGLTADTGTSPTDGITNNQQITVGLASGTDHWTYSTDGGMTWSANQANTVKTFNLADNTIYAANNIEVQEYDLAGNSTISKIASAITVDTTGPTVSSITYSSTSQQVTYTFSEAVTGFTSSNIKISGGAKLSNFTGSGANYTQTVTKGSSSKVTIDSKYTDFAGNSGSEFTSSRSFPAGIAGQPINLALVAPSSDYVGLVTLTITSVPTGWMLSEGINNSDGSWTVQSANVANLTITTLDSYTGAQLLTITQQWTQTDGSFASSSMLSNIEAYAPDSPIFAISDDDNLSGSIGADTFVFAQPMGNNKVFNFNASMDKIDLIGFTGINGYTDLTITDDGQGNALITNGAGQSITLMGVHAIALSAINFIFNVEPIMYNTATMVISDGAILPLGGTVVNTGSIVLDSSGTTTNLEVLIKNVTLEGGGKLVLSDNANNVILGGAQDAALINIDNIISGAGQLGAGQMTLRNSGVILANGVNALLIDTGTNKVVNTQMGILQSVGTGGLQIAGGVVNTGLIWANGGNIVIDGDAIGAGIALISGMATLEFGAASDQYVNFAPVGDGMLILDDASAFSGRIHGFNAGDRINLENISFGVNDTVTYVANDDGTGGKLCVSDGMHTAQLEIDGQYIAAGLQSDGAGGSELAYGMAATSNSMLGGSANDLLTGGAGNDLLQGGIGNDMLIGGLGADVFKWSLSDQRNEGNPANDIVKDFSIAQGDRLDLSDLLTGEHDGSTDGLANNLTSYLHFEKSSSGSDTVISISTSGDFKAGFDSAKVDQTITLEQVVVDVIGNSTQLQIIDDLMKQQVIRLDH